MKCYLQIRALGELPRIAITGASYSGAHDARQHLSSALYIEQKWDILLQNYIELEKDILSLALEHVTLDDSGYATMSAALSIASKRYVNLLTSARMYVDQVPRLAVSILGVADSAEPNESVKALLSKQYDDCFEYRFMEALRNYVQHFGSPVHSLTSGASWTREFNREWSEASVQPYALRATLENDKSFKRSLLREMPEKVNLVVAVRRYMECLGLVQKRIRELVAPQVKSARSKVEGLIGKYAETHGKKPVGLAAHRVNSDGKIEHFPLLLEWDDVRIGLASRNSTLANISKRTVTGRATQ